MLEPGEFGLPRPARLPGGLVGEHLGYGRVDAALAQRGRDPGLLEGGVGQVSARGEAAERTPCALDRLGERGRRVERRVVEDPLLVGGLAGTTVVRQRARRRLGRMVAKQREDVGFAHPVGRALGRAPQSSERAAAASEVPDGIDRLAGRALEVRSPAKPVAHEPHGLGREPGERREQRVDLASGGALHVVELVLELGELAGHRLDLTDLVRDLGDLVRDHLGALEPTPEVELGARGRGARERQEREKQGGDEDAVMHGRVLSCHRCAVGVGISASEANQMRSRWPARTVISGIRLRNRSRTEVALLPSPWPTPARSP